MSKKIKIIPHSIKIKAIRNAPPLKHIIRAITLQLDEITQTTLLDMIPQQSRPQLKRKTLNALKSYAVLRYITLIEIFFLVLVKEYYDKNHFDLSKFFQNTKMPIQSSKSIKKHKMTFKKNEIISSNFNFQNLDVINDIMSEILGVNFINSMVDYLQTPTDTKAKEPFAKKNLLKYWSDFNQMFDDRNKISHSIKEIQLNSGHVRVLGWLVETFMIFSAAMAENSRNLRKQRVAKSNFSNRFRQEFENAMKPYY